VSAKTDIVICEPLRTPVGKYGGSLKSKSAADLGAVVLRELVARTALDPSAIDDIILGNCSPTAEAPAPAPAAGKPAGPVGPTRDRFEPTEKVRADFDVSFPVDI
jgi:acetyl-CoA C-acetyltransferase